MRLLKNRRTDLRPQNLSRKTSKQRKKKKRQGHTCAKRKIEKGEGNDFSRSDESTEKRSPIKRKKKENLKKQGGGPIACGLLALQRSEGKVFVSLYWPEKFQKVSSDKLKDRYLKEKREVQRKGD